MRIHVLKVSCVGLSLWLSMTSALAQGPPVQAPEALAIAAPTQEPPTPPPPQAPAPRGQMPPQPATAPGAPQPRAQTPLPPARMQGQPINVRIELTITDQTGTAPAAKKTVLMTVADEERGSIRSTAQISRGGPVQTVPLSVDATPTVLSDTRVRVRLSLDYDVAGAAMGTPPFIPIPGAAASEPEGKPRDDRWGSQVRQSLGVVLASGVPLIVAQSADPQTDRRVSLEVKATILK